MIGEVDIVARAPLGLIPPGKTDRELAWPPSLPSKPWKARLPYMTQTVMNHRIGFEPYSARWTPQEGNRVPRRADRRETILSIVR